MKRREEFKEDSAETIKNNIKNNKKYFKKMRDEFQKYLLIEGSRESRCWIRAREK